jgi:hypothetical protein
MILWKNSMDILIGVLAIIVLAGFTAFCLWMGDKDE